MEILEIMLKDKPLADRIVVDGEVRFKLNGNIEDWEIPKLLFTKGKTVVTEKEVIEWAVARRNPREMGVDPFKTQLRRGIYRCDTWNIVKEHRASRFGDYLWLKLTNEDVFEVNCLRGRLENLGKGECIMFPE